MATSRRSFLKRGASALTLSTLASQAMAEDVADALLTIRRKSINEAVTDELQWARIAQAFTVSRNVLNLNNGGVSPQPKVVQDAAIRYYQFCNEAPTYHMWQLLDKGREPLRAKLAQLGGVSSEEIAVNRNATEALGTVTWGLSLEKGDEVVMSKQDYPNMVHAWKQKELRDGIKIKWISFSFPIENDDDIIRQFVEASTPKTKVWHLTHMVNWNGQILPVKKLCAEARKRSIKTIVDGAHTFAHLDFKISDLNADYFGTSLHKWLCAPFGTGMLYVKKENIRNLWPLFPNDSPQSDNIRKFETLGTRSFAPEQAIGEAILFHESIGGKLKEERLRYLKNYWCEKVATIKRVKLNTSLKPEYSCALANFSIEGMEPEQLSSRLFNEFQIIASPVKWENISGVRITPHIYTLTKDLDRLVEAISKIASI